MKKLSKILFALIIMSTVVFTSCVDYTVPYNKLPVPQGMGGAYLQEFDNIVIGKNWYSAPLNTGKGTIEQKRIHFDPPTRTFTIETYTWNEATKQGINSNIFKCQLLGLKNIANLQGDIIYRGISPQTTSSNSLSYKIDGADVAYFGEIKYISNNALGLVDPNNFVDRIRFYPNWQ